MNSPKKVIAWQSYALKIPKLSNRMSNIIVHMTYLHDPTWTIDISTYILQVKKNLEPSVLQIALIFFSFFRTALIEQIFVLCLQNRVGILFYSFTCISKINLRGLFITRQLMQLEYQGIIQITFNFTVFNSIYFLWFTEKPTKLRPIFTQ